MTINYEEDVGNEIPSDEKLLAVSTLVDRLQFQKRHVLDLSAQLQLEQDKLKRLEEVELPLALKDCGLKDVTLTDGTKVLIKENIYASITKANEKAAHDWLLKHGLGDVIKSTVSVKFGRGEAQNRDDLIKLISQQPNMSMPEVKEGVNANTLKALVKEQLEKGVDIPLDVFGVFKQEVAIVEIKEK